MPGFDAMTSGQGPGLPGEAAVCCGPENVLVVVPALNEAAAIEACIASLRAGDGFMEHVRIVIADGGSSDGTQDIVAGLAAADPMLQLVHNPDRLQSAGVNRAVDSAARPEHTILVRCDAHSVYPPGYVRRVAEAFAARPEAASVATVMDAAGHSGFERACAWVVDTPLGSGGSQHRGGGRSQWVDHGHHAGFRLDWFRRIGGYNPRFSHNEDAEYDRRLVLAGGRIWLDAENRLVYRMRPSLAALMRQYWNYGCGRARTVLEHRMRPRLRQLVPVLNVLGLLGSLALGAVWPPALIWPAAYAAALLAVSLTGALCLRGPSGLWAGAALGVMHNAWGLGFLRIWAAAWVPAWLSGVMARGMQRAQRMLSRSPRP
ncbi:glycosyltransferase family 2 protein [Leisingera sp. M527]|uniref:glycosyltransferase family 2 protein n=1 Tax=Leisingera sp. M527 TaxID=2867014 RepID=UPI0021A3B7EA|nr:glycosyltransferase family 2 protein [Leisingera sp. M527]